MINSCGLNCVVLIVMIGIACVLFIVVCLMCVLLGKNMGKRKEIKATQRHIKSWDKCHTNFSK